MTARFRLPALRLRVRNHGPSATVENPTGRWSPVAVAQVPRCAPATQVRAVIKAAGAAERRRGVGRVPTRFVRKYTVRAQLKPSGAPEPASGHGRPAAAGDRRGSVRNKRTFWPNSSAAWNTMGSVVRICQKIPRSPHSMDRPSTAAGRVGVGEQSERGLGDAGARRRNLPPPPHRRIRPRQQVVGSATSELRAQPARPPLPSRPGPRAGVERLRARRLATLRSGWNALAPTHEPRHRRPPDPARGAVARAAGGPAPASRRCPRW